MPDFFASLIAAPIAYAALQGADPEPLIRASGVPAALLSDPDARVSYDAVVGLWTHLVHEVFPGEPLGGALWAVARAGGVGRVWTVESPQPVAARVAEALCQIATPVGSSACHPGA